MIISRIVLSIADLLFPANSDLVGSPVMTFAIWFSDSILYFEGALPNNTVYAKMDSIALSKEEVEGLSKRRSAKTALSSNVLSKAETADEILGEVQASESWRMFVNPVTEDDIVMLDDAGAIVENFGISTRASVTGIPSGMPVDVFQKLGSWGCVNNPSNQANGYIAITTRRGGTTDVNETQLLQWGYIFNNANNLTSGSTVSNGGAISLQLKATGIYVYYASQNKIQLENSNGYLKITDAAIAMGLRSGEQILTKSASEIKSQGSAVTINWKAALGLIPVGYIQTAVELFSLVEYKEVENSIANALYPDTADLQKKNYGKLIRGRKLVHNGKQLTKNGDYFSIEYTVKQPKDLSRTTGTKYVSNKYFFFVYGRDMGAYTNKIKTVNEIRESSYYVYK